MDETDNDPPALIETELRSAPSLPVPRRRRDVTAPVRRKPPAQMPDFTGMAPPRPMDATYGEFLPAAERIVATEPSRARRGIAYGLCGFIAASLVWSVFWHFSIFAVAPGQFQARVGAQVVEPMESGQISSVPVKNGDHVRKGDIVLQMDPTAAQAAQTIVAAQLADARAETVRHYAAAIAARSAAIDPKPPVSWPKDIPDEVKTRQESVLRADLALLAASISNFQAQLAAAISQRDKYTANIASQTTLIDSRTQRTAQHEKLAEQGWDSRAMVLQSMEPLRQDQVNLANYQGGLDEAKASIPVIEDQIAQARQTFIASNTDAGAAADRRSAELVQQLAKAELTLRNLGLRAPVTGTVQSLAVTNVGQSVKVGEQLMRIAPDDSPLEVQAYVLNTDIGFIQAGQPVTLKVDTFPYTRYGTISGKVTHVGADAITGAFALAQQKNGAATPSQGSLSVTNAAQQMSDLVFPVTIAPDRTTIDVEGRAVPLTAGMSVVAEIETERQRAITYILYPLTKAFSGQ